MTDAVFKKYSPAVKIAFASFVIAAFGLLAESTFEVNNIILRFFFGLFRPLNLKWMERSGFPEFITLNQFFYLLLFFGALFYTVSKQKETRLIRFVFVLIFLSKIVLALMIIATVIGIHWPESYLFRWLLEELCYLVVNAAWIWLSWRVLKYFNQVKLIEKAEHQYGEEVSVSYTDATLWQRFFHMVADSIIAVMVFCWVLRPLIWMDGVQHFLLALQAVVGERGALTLVILFFGTIYYVLTEGLFGASPAKLLTETRILTDSGHQPGIGNILGRTICRYVPFESLSFFGMRGWHDRWSGTQVVREVRQGVNGSRYFLIIPAYLVLLAGGSYFNSAYQKYRNTRRHNKEIEKERAELASKFDKVTTNDYFVLSPRIGQWEYTDAYLKAEHVSQNNISFVILTPSNRYDAPIYYLEQLYNQGKGLLDSVTYSKQALKNAFIDTDQSTDTSKSIRIGRIYYSLKKIETCCEVNIKLGDVSSYGKEINIQLVSTGWPAQLVDMDVVDGDVKMEDSFPKKVYTNIRNINNGYLMLKGIVTNPDADFKINFTLMDTLGRKQVYQVSGSGNPDDERTLTRLK